MIQLVTPMLYLRVKHPQKRVFDLWVPLAMTAIFLLCVYASGVWTGFYEQSTGVSVIADKLLVLMSALSGFFVAALAAIATFNKPNLDDLMSGDPPTLKHGIYQSEPEKLTRRRFLSLMFGYLAFCSFVFTIMLICAPFVGNIVHHIGGFVVVENFKFGRCLKFSVIALYSFFFFHIFVTTLLGLHYLSERMGRD